MTFIRYFWTIILFLPLTDSVLARDNVNCGIKVGAPLTNAYGPWDFTNPEHQIKLPIVLTAHFTDEVESLVKGTTNTTPHADIDYTLRAIPNYHRALYAVAKLELSDRKNLKKGQNLETKHYTADCYFRRAIYFQPKDGVSYMLYALYLHKLGRLEDAAQKYEVALQLEKNNAELHYNAGLLYLDMGRISLAKEHASVAKSLGYPMMGLHKKLEKY